MVVFWACTGISPLSIAASQAPPLSSRSFNFWDQGGAVADLDGDGLPDVVLVRQEGEGREGIRYRIDFQLSANTNANYIRVYGDLGGLRIEPRDVDADGDLDLVITAAWSAAPVGVWINDGHGNFRQGDISAYPSSLWTDSASVSSRFPAHSIETAISPSTGSSNGCVSRRGFLDKSLAGLTVNSQKGPAPLVISMGAQKSRAPPLSAA